MDDIKGIYIECNIEQSKIFAEQLKDRTAIDFSPMVVNDLKSMDIKSKELIQGSQIIITTFNHVNEVRRLLRNYNKTVLGVAITPNLETIVKIARFPLETKFLFVCITKEFKFKSMSALENAGLDNVDITYTNSFEKDKLKEEVRKCDVIIVSPGRHHDVEDICEGKAIINFDYNLDDGSVKALKSKLLEVKYLK